MCLSVSLYACLDVCLHACMLGCFADRIHISICLPLCQSVCIGLSIHLSMCLFVSILASFSGLSLYAFCMSMFVFTPPTFYLSVNLSVCRYSITHCLLTHVYIYSTQRWQRRNGVKKLLIGASCSLRRCVLTCTQ
jgi:uncharacterized membrane protein